MPVKVGSKGSAAGIESLSKLRKHLQAPSCGLLMRDDAALSIALAHIPHGPLYDGSQGAVYQQADAGELGCQEPKGADPPICSGHAGSLEGLDLLHALEGEGVAAEHHAGHRALQCRWWISSGTRWTAGKDR